MTQRIFHRNNKGEVPRFAGHDDGIVFAGDVPRDAGLDDGIVSAGDVYVAPDWLLYVTSH